jgi:hypothetical protein
MTNAQEGKEKAETEEAGHGAESGTEEPLRRASVLTYLGC